MWTGDTGGGLDSGGEGGGPGEGGQSPLLPASLIAHYDIHPEFVMHGLRGP